MNIQRHVPLTDRPLRLAVCGLGCRGTSMLSTLLDMDGVEIRALCERYPDRLEAGSRAVVQAGGAAPLLYDNITVLLSETDADALLLFTSWNNHLGIAVQSMEAGIPVAFEVGGAYSIDECFRLVRTHEKTGVPCMMLENCCYGRTEMTLLRMIRENLFGELVQCRGGYLHDLRDEVRLGRENRHYRFEQYLRRNGELYPTHHMGPILKYLDINRGNRMLTLSSVATKAVGLNDFARTRLEKDADRAPLPFAQGDIVVTTMKCARGELILSTHDTTLPRPYSRGGLVQGTRGIWQEDGNGIYLEGKSVAPHTWDSFDPWLERYEHPLWSEYRSLGVRGGHDGMDYLVLSAFLEGIRYGTTLPVDVYDSATLAALSVLSEQSVALGGTAVPVPDFTSGAWTTPADRPLCRHPATDKYLLDRVCSD